MAFSEQKSSLIWFTRIVPVTDVNDCMSTHNELFNNCSQCVTVLIHYFLSLQEAYQHLAKGLMIQISLSLTFVGMLINVQNVPNKEFN